MSPPNSISQELGKSKVGETESVWEQERMRYIKKMRPFKYTDQGNDELTETEAKCTGLYQQGALDLKGEVTYLLIPNSGTIFNW